MAIDPTQVFVHVLDTARRNLPAVTSARQAAREALQQAQRCLSQSAFFACLDAVGGQEAALDLIECILGPPEELGAHGGVGGRGATRTQSIRVDQRLRGRHAGRPC
jgi:hypothetical protein